jgi:hypothetical protein
VNIQIPFAAYFAGTCACSAGCSIVYDDKATQAGVMRQRTFRTTDVFKISPGTLRKILIAGFIAGTIDVGAACVINSLGPVVILKAIAAGILGPASFRGGAAVAALGLILQWLMSWDIAAVYLVAAANMPILRARWILSGLAYGMVVFIVMNFIVMPLSAVGHFPTFTVIRAVGNLLAMFLFGLIISYFGSRAPRQDPAPPDDPGVTNCP